ncbi:hypothetical protein KBC31_01795 [Candidatus Saccharibacteria bacterium]|jgi:hypothetical protein|nr:hypothetical protein [Candidatus Saccharibacteria bacterium]
MPDDREPVDHQNDERGPDFEVPLDAHTPPQSGGETVFDHEAWRQRVQNRSVAVAKTMTNDAINRSLAILNEGGIVTKDDDPGAIAFRGIIPHFKPSLMKRFTRQRDVGELNDHSSRAALIHSDDPTPGVLVWLNGCELERFNNMRDKKKWPALEPDETYKTADEDLTALLFLNAVYMTDSRNSGGPTVLIKEHDGTSGEKNPRRGYFGLTPELPLELMVMADYIEDGEGHSAVYSSSNYTASTMPRPITAADQ